MYRYFLAFLSLLLINSCQNTRNEKVKINFDSEVSDSVVTSLSADYVKKAKFIFYNMSSPIEMAQIFENSETDFNIDLLYDHNQYTNYLSSKEIALVMGIYGVDLSYARMYNQTQLSVNYLSVIKKLTEKLGVPEDYVSLTTSNIENNISNRDSLFRIANEAYLAANKYLKGNERQTTASLILLGGWIEAIYIAVGLLDPENPDIELMKKIAEQKYALNSLVSLLKNDTTDVDIKNYITQLSFLNQDLQDFAKFVKGDAGIDEVLPNSEEDKINADYINSIQDKMLEIRNLITL